MTRLRFQLFQTKQISSPATVRWAADLDDDLGDEDLGDEVLDDHLGDHLGDYPDDYLDYGWYYYRSDYRGDDRDYDRNDSLDDDHHDGLGDELDDEPVADGDPVPLGEFPELAESVMPPVSCPLTRQECEGTETHPPSYSTDRIGANVFPLRRITVRASDNGLVTLSLHPQFSMAPYVLGHVNGTDGGIDLEFGQPDPSALPRARTSFAACSDPILNFELLYWVLMIWNVIFATVLLAWAIYLAVRVK